MTSRNPFDVNRRDAIRLMGGAAALLAAGRASAQDKYPPDVLTIFCGYQPGGLADTTSRRVGQGLGSLWGSSVINESRPGANGNIAAGLVAKAAPDGKTLLVAAYDTLAITAAAKLDVGFDPLNDLAPVALIGEIENWMVASPNAPFNTVPEFIAYVKKNPDKISWGSNGVGSSGHLAMEQINAQLGVQMVHIPYKGATMLTDLMTDAIQVALSSRSSTQGYVKEGKMKVLAKTGDKRSPLSPELPTFADGGLGQIVVPYAMAAFLPGSSPKPLVDRFNQDIRKALQDPTIRGQFEAAGMPVGDISPEAFKARIAADVTVIADVIRKNKVSLGG